MKRKILSIGAATAIAFAGVAGISACSSDGGAKDDKGTEQPASNESAGESTDAGDNAGTREDLEVARQTVLDTMADKGDMTEIMLASDVKAPEQKYGMWVVPYSWGEETEKVDSKISIDGKKFTIKGTAVDGTVLEIDQDGNITVVE
ncbi:hypothetical protein U6G28_04565 [Actinomycetaceae bacterium MB13-C1-2]|nr:hypothetical protein U6G28_04565 [Actinomycetaceae bacterium MB13-C1-2]